MALLFERARWRLLTLIISVVGLMGLGLYYIMTPPTSLISTLPPPHPHKVSLIICLEEATPTQITTTYKDIHEALLSMKLDYEVIVVHPTPTDTHPYLDGHHVQVVNGSPCHGGFSKAHYGVILLIGANVTSYHSSIPQLLLPIINGQSEITFGHDYTQSDDTSMWQRLLMLMVLPLTGSLYVPDDNVLSMVTSLWTQGCHGIHDDVIGGSISVELVSRCSTKLWSVHPISIETSEGHSHTIQLSQVGHMLSIT
jgi:hypothetical protein